MKTINMGSFRNCFAFVVLTGLTACGGGDPIDSRAVLMASCETSQGIGWLKREYGNSYCDCWADQAKDVLSGENYQTLVKAAQAETAAADKADREKIIRRHTEIYSAVSDATNRCAKAG
ncbi:hypothetical protein [Sedimenticola hydrogenitrophicus]|uniref:hypothetical protein n=1 Tax=Sedimenticola hydrogenitrophicus TaxID=2967975 RepID=UPI0023AF0DA8|nr:hypothetical protein [Sedimenticola hydrogenitrophicus]